MTIMQAKYSGTCAATGRKFRPGATIDYDRKARTAVLVDATGGADQGRYISDVIRIGRQEFYRNKNGRCEDAPCCGCCTI